MPTRVLTPPPASSRCMVSSDIAMDVSTHTEHERAGRQSKTSTDWRLDASTSGATWVRGTFLPKRSSCQISAERARRGNFQRRLVSDLTAPPLRLRKAHSPCRAKPILSLLEQSSIPAASCHKPRANHTHAHRGRRLPRLGSNLDAAASVNTHAQRQS